jgi:hypothetical protein
LTESPAAVKSSTVVPGPVAQLMHRRCAGPHFGHLRAGREDFGGSVSAEVIDALVACAWLTLSVINCQAKHRKRVG